MVIKSVLNEADKLLIENNIKAIPLSFKDLRTIAKSVRRMVDNYISTREGSY